MFPNKPFINRIDVMRSMSKVRNLESWNPVDGKLDHCMATSGGFKSHLYTITVNVKKTLNIVIL